MYWNTYRLSYSGHVIFKVAIKKDNEAYPHINGSMKKLATRAICTGHLASCSNFDVGQAAVNLLSQIQLKSVTLLFSLSLSLQTDACQHAFASVVVQQRLLLPLSLHHAVYVVNSVCRDVTSLRFLAHRTIV